MVSRFLAVIRNAREKAPLAPGYLFGELSCAAWRHGEPQGIPEAIGIFAGREAVSQRVL